MRTGTTATPFTFVGTLGYYKDVAGRLYVRARTYLANLARWLTVDPLWPWLPAYDYVFYKCNLIVYPSGLLAGDWGTTLPQPIRIPPIIERPPTTAIPPGKLPPWLLGPIGAALIATIPCLVSIIAGQSPHDECVNCCTSIAGALGALAGVFISPIVAWGLTALVAALATVECPNLCPNETPDPSGCIIIIRPRPKPDPGWHTPMASSPPWYPPMAPIAG